MDLNRGLHVLSKPIGPICNLDCAYCYYLEKEDLYPENPRWRMSESTLRKYIEQQIAAQPSQVPVIDFAWQGGEPTLLGIEFFERAVQLQSELTPPGKTCRNSIQTNGVLLDDAWCAFLAEHQFLVGLSIDGPKKLHDAFRYDKQEQPTFTRVMDGWKRLKRFRVEHNLLTVLHRKNADHPLEVYDFLRRNGAQVIQFIPLVERVSMENANVSPRSVLPRQFGEFLVKVFDKWIAHDVGQVFIQTFEEALHAWMGNEPTICIFRQECGRAVALEHNGDVYSCDHFVNAEHRLGNIHEHSLEELVELPEQLAFGQAKRDLPQYCQACDVRFACNGECPKNRFTETPSGEAGLNYLCAGYKRFFQHIDPAMRSLVGELRSGRSPQNVMQQFRPADSPPAKLSRNSACPCGSGKKYKQCCLRKPR